MNTKNVTNIRSRGLASKIFFSIILLLVFGIIGFFSYYHYWHHTNNVVSTKQTRGNVLSFTNGKGQTNTSINSTSGNNSQSTNLQGLAPTNPSGNFVSDHNSTLNTHELSTCNTTPGATCEITFTSGTITKTLPKEQADASGATSWTWTPQNLALSNGSWTITATSTLNNKSSSTKDPLLLVVN